jgi:PncC family amidohydrolase
MSGATVADKVEKVEKLERLAQELSTQLSLREERIVFAESCTCGMLAAVLGRISGISNYLCGSAVTYRADSKHRWLGVNKKTIKRRTTESHEVASEMAFGIIKKTPEASWAISVVGHVGPDAPTEKDGVIYACIVRRTKKGKLKTKETIEHRLSSNKRRLRQNEAVEVIFSHLTRLLLKKSGQESHNVGINGKKKTKKISY